MSRLELGGYEGPIPNIALPDPKLSADLPIQSLVLENGDNFQKAEWVALGYTHYEVWCVGAAGGQGASAADNVIRSLNTPTQERYPDWLWAEMKAQYVHDYYPSGTVAVNTGRMLPPTADAPYGVAEVLVMTSAEYFEYLNPTHMAQINNHHDPFTTETDVIGGAGGGGGLHVVSGNLVDLPNSVPVTVGAAGAQPAPGQIASPNPYDPFTPEALALDPRRFSNQASYDQYVFVNRWPAVGARTLLLPPQPGADGGYSAFGSIAMASGGKGGGPAIVWDNYVRMFAAHGGQGGAGGRTQAGGGADGSISANISGKDGTWDGSIGTGGGGGRGGMAEIKPDALQYAVGIGGITSSSDGTALV